MASDEEAFEQLNKIASKAKYNILSTEKFKAKFKSELIRTLYYMLVGYEGPHPWGVSAKPAYPEYSPLPVRNKACGKQAREAVESLISSRDFEVMCKKILADMDKKVSKL